MYNLDTKRMSIISDLDIEQIKNFYEIHRFHGFDPRKIREEFESKITDKKIQIEILTILSCNSPKRCEQIVLRNGKTLSQIGINHGNRKGLSPARLINAYALDIVKIRKLTSQPKRIEDSKCPAEYQLLGIGSAIPQDQQASYRSFCMEFSKLIMGAFKEDLFNLSLRK